MNIYSISMKRKVFVLSENEFQILDPQKVKRKLLLYLTLTLIDSIVFLIMVHTSASAESGAVSGFSSLDQDFR